jgi:hypothetical protein
MRSVEVQLSATDIQLFDWLKEKTNLRTDREVLDTAVTILRWCVEQSLEHRQVASVDCRRKAYRPLLIPALRYAASSAEKVA